MGKPRSDGKHDLLNSSWLRWLILAVCVVAWIGITYKYPIYHQRDDLTNLYWTRQHSFVDCLVPAPGRGIVRDSMYRPTAMVILNGLYEILGLKPHGWHLVLGLTFILSQAFLFKLVSRIRDYQAGYLTILIWLAAFQSLMTVLFWFVNIVIISMMMLTISAVYFLITGFRSSSPGKIVLGSVLMLLSFGSKESSLFMAPTATALYLAIEGLAQGKRGRGKTILYSILPILAACGFLAAFPFALRGQAAHGGGLAETWSLAIMRFDFYSGFLLSGITGLVLLVPALYLIASRLMGGKDGERRSTWFLAGAVLAALAIIKLEMHVIGIAVLLAGAFCLPKRDYIFIPWAFLIPAALCFFRGMFRTYLYEPSFAFAIIAALQTREMLGDLAAWWRAHVRWPAVTYAAVALIVISVVGVGAVKIRKQVEILQARSDITMAVADTTPYLMKLPAGSVLVVVDYESMGWEKPWDMALLPDSERVRLQSPVPYYYLPDWVKVIGRSDLKVTSLGDYRADPRRFGKSRVYLWLTTPRDHEYFAGEGIPNRTFAVIRRGAARMDLLELAPG